ncbi:MAG TPA: NADH-quinone oxidoreductase subunit NuoF [Chthoniobacteraceae bacterium]|jgi:NADH-quinone oxidoreductase subunit F|nr:NADH-quinone oxidoreductase subunit NuoF [Chthoniobacteraceae bacterium]
MNLPAELSAKIDEVITHYPVSRRSATLPLLHLIQEQFGFVSDEAITWIAAKLEIEPINVLELVTFYPMFRRQPAGQTHIRVCRTLSCAMAGSYQLLDKVCAAAGIERHGHDHGNPVAVSADGKYSIEFVECLASCGTAPVAMSNDDFHERVTDEAIPQLLESPGSSATVPKIHPPHWREKRIVFQNIDREGWSNDIEKYLLYGGYQEMKKAFAMPRADIVNEVKASGLRGRGGAGFPCGVKWSFIKPDEKKPVYLICNADESEPGTFKDRYIIHQDPHQLIEGMIIACYAVNARLAYIYIRGEFPEGAQILEKALAEAKAKGFLGKNILGSGFDLEIYVHRGAGAYICGEETGLIESLEGKRAYPRIKPPYFPAVLGLYQCPTIVNNVETLCHVKHIVRMGGAEYAKLGRPNNTGTRILCVSGDVQKPGYFEVEVGSLTMGELINEVCGGPKPGRTIKAVTPGGSSAKVLSATDRYKIKEKQADGTMTEKEISLDDIPMDFDTLAAVGSMAGSGGVIVMDDTRDMVWTLNNINEFYAHESCGQCTPCREGSLWMKKITDRILAGGGVTGDANTLKGVADNIAGRTICAFGEACAWPTQSFIAKFKPEFEARATKPLPPPMPPEILPEELIANTEIQTLRGPHSEGTNERIAVAGSTSSKEELASHEH